MSKPVTNLPVDDDLDSVFEEKSSRLAWVVPSILLHVVVVAVWIFAPDNEPIRREERKLVIKSQQAEQLKGFVEDANLQELRAELGELQAIKSAMLKIRAQRMTELGKFETSLGAELPEDLHESVTGIVDAQAATAQELQRARAVAARFEASYTAVQPLLSADHLGELQPRMTALRDERRKVEAALDEVNLKHERVGQLIAQAQTLYEWIADESLLKPWSTLQARHKEAEELHLKHAELIRQKLRVHEREIEELANQAQAHAQFLVDMEKKTADGSAQYAAKKKELEDRLAALEEKDKEVQATIGRLETESRTLETDYENLKREISAMPAKSAEEKQAKSVRGEDLKKSRTIADDRKKDIRSQQEEQRRIAKDSGNARNELGRLKPFELNGGERGRIEKTNKMLESLRGAPEPTADLVDQAIAAQNQAKQAGTDVMSSVTVLLASQAQKKAE